MKSPLPPSHLDSMEMQFISSASPFGQPPEEGKVCSIIHRRDGAELGSSERPRAETLAHPPETCGDVVVVVHWHLASHSAARIRPALVSPHSLTSSTAARSVTARGFRVCEVRDSVYGCVGQRKRRGDGGDGVGRR